MTQLDSKSLRKYFSELQSFCDLWNPLKNKISFKTFTNSKETLKGIGPIIAIKNSKIQVLDYSTKKRITIEKDFAGLYLFSKDGQPFYCGISRNVIKRILDHQKGSTSSMATLAHRIAKKECIDKSEEEYMEAFSGEKKKLLECDMSLVKFYDPQDNVAHEEDPTFHHKEEIMLYLFEVFVSVSYNTEHNTFRTH